MFNPTRVDSLASFLEAQAYQFHDSGEGIPPTDDPPNAKSWNVFKWAA